VDETIETGEVLVPLTLDGGRVLLSVRPLITADPGEEMEIAARSPSLDEVVDGIAAMVRSVADRFQDLDASKVTLEFGCEIGVESGSLVAVLGKATAKSAFKVGLEWSKQGR
jgi:hypothetical protein